MSPSGRRGVQLSAAHAQRLLKPTSPPITAYDRLEYNSGNGPRRRVIIEGMIDIGWGNSSSPADQQGGKKAVLIEGAHRPIGYAASDWRRPAAGYILEDPTPVECDVDVHNALLQQIESSQAVRDDGEGFGRIGISWLRSVVSRASRGALHEALKPSRKVYDHSALRISQRRPEAAELKVRSAGVEHLLGEGFELPAYSVVASNAKKLTEADLDPDSFYWLHPERLADPRLRRERLKALLERQAEEAQLRAARLTAREAENARFTVVPVEERKHVELLERLQRLFVECWRPRIIPPVGHKDAGGQDDLEWILLPWEREELVKRIESDMLVDIFAWFYRIHSNLTHHNDMYVLAGSQMCALVDGANNLRPVPDAEKGEMHVSDFLAVTPYVDGLETELHAKLLFGRLCRLCRVDPSTTEALPWAAVLKACKLHKAALSPAGGRRQQRAPSRVVDPVSLIRRDLESTNKMVRGEVMRQYVPMDKFNDYFSDPANIELLITEHQTWSRMAVQLEGLVSYSAVDLEKLLAGREGSQSSTVAGPAVKETKEIPLAELSYYLPMQRCLDLFKEHWAARVIPPVVDRELMDPTGVLLDHEVTTINSLIRQNNLSGLLKYLTQVHTVLRDAEEGYVKYGQMMVRIIRQAQYTRNCMLDPDTGRGHYGEDLTYFSRKDNIEANKELEGTSIVDAEECFNRLLRLCRQDPEKRTELSWVLASKAMEQHYIAINPPEGEVRRSPSRYYDLRSLATMPPAAVERVYKSRLSNTTLDLNAFDRHLKDPDVISQFVFNHDTYGALADKLQEWGVAGKYQSHIEIMEHKESKVRAMEQKLQEQVKKALEKRRGAHDDEASVEAMEAAETAEMEDKLAEAGAAIPYQPRQEQRQRFVLDMSVFHDKRTRSTGGRGDLDVQGYSKAELAELLRVPVEEVEDVADLLRDDYLLLPRARYPDEMAEAISQELTRRSLKQHLRRAEGRVRPPVVTVMGHVDHGKTTLLDALRKSNVAAGEAGGITQRVGAFTMVGPATAERITFIDTPGHAAFSSMRERGANVTDIVVLLVAADDGIRQQTVEAVQHARVAGCPIIVAISKIDKAEDNRVQMLEKELREQLGLVSENLGGNVQVIPICAPKEEGLVDLEEAMLLEASVIDEKDETALEFDRSMPAKAFILESRIHHRQGRILNLVMRDGALHVGDWITIGEHAGRVRTIWHAGRETYPTEVDPGGHMKGVDPIRSRVRIDFETGNAPITLEYPSDLDEAVPSDAVDVSVVWTITSAKHGGIVGSAGDLLQAHPNQRVAEEIAKTARLARMQEELHTTPQDQGERAAGKHIKKVLSRNDPTMQKKIDEWREKDTYMGLKENEDEEQIQRMVEGTDRQVGLILKAASEGQLKVLRSWLEEYAHSQSFYIAASSVGQPTDHDVDFAKQTASFILSFQEPPKQAIVDRMRSADLVLRHSEIIYRLFQDVEDIYDFHYGPREVYTRVCRLNLGKPAPFFIKGEGTRTIGRATLRDGVATTGDKISYNILRKVGGDSSRVEVVREGLKLRSITVDRMTVKQVPKGQEAGILFEEYDDLEEGDVVEGFERSERPPLFGVIKKPRFYHEA
ncbi:hypothetical protein FOL47_011201 [Perkinsus chesapeaki]|uniref:Tr-type G domain-containing protein n=1 Tax=Perkinsus chesapeaki TaxID=330153 RepID=A0A7J6MMX7_PERCH|nr:hypothetical protein FOL47_011201 [Perkinsus chesapeaki]